MSGWHGEDWKLFFEGVGLVVTALLSGLAAWRAGMASNAAQRAQELVTEHEERAIERHNLVAEMISKQDKG